MNKEINNCNSLTHEILKSLHVVPSIDIQTGSWASYRSVVEECLASYRCQMCALVSLFHAREHMF